MKDWQSDLKPFINLISSQWHWMSLGTLNALAAALSVVGLLALSGWFISATAFAGLTLSTAHLFNFFPPSIGVRFFAVSRTLTRYLERLLSHDATLRILQELRAWLYRCIEPLVPGALGRYRSGDILNRVVDDVDALDNLYVRVLSPSIVAAIALVVVGFFIAIYDAMTAIAAIACMVLAGVVLPAAATRYSYPTARQLAKDNAALRTRVIDGLQGLAALLVFGATQRHLEHINAANRRFLLRQLRMSYISAFTGALITVCTGSAVIMALYIAAGPVSRGTLNGAYLALILLAIMAAFEAIAPLPTAFQFLGRTREAGRRLLEIAETEASVVFPDQSPTAPKRFDLQFKEVCFQYPDRLNAAVKDVSLTIPHGQHVALVGETGAGKSTLLNLLARFYDPVEGQIQLGDTDLRKFNKADLREHLTIIDQQAHLFSTTVRENLLIANSDATKADLWYALEQAQMKAFVKALPQGLDTWVGESGRLLSGGQARRLMIARAILRQSPIWVMDEPTEGLDHITEEKVWQSLIDCCRDRTLIIITHRLHHLNRMGRIVLMENGTIIEQGSHRELLNSNGRYAKLQARLF